MNFSTISRPKESICPDLSKIYGIEIKPLQSLQQLKEIWSSRTIDTYTLLPLIKDIEASLWRNIKTGKITTWDSSMLSPSLKKNTPIIENYILLDNLSNREYFRLSLEYLASKIYSLKKACSKGEESYKLDEIVKDICDEITTKNNQNPQISFNSVEYYPFLKDVITLLQENPQIDSEESKYIQSLAVRHRFFELNDKLQYGDWTANCLAIHEIESDRLFACQYNSLREYVTESETVDITYDEYLRRSKAGGVVKLLSSLEKTLPTNKSQAIALAEIPSTNMLKVWDIFLARQGRKSVKLIEQIHEEIIFGKAAPATKELHYDIEKVKPDIEYLLQETQLQSDPIKVMLKALLKKATISALELKLVRTIKRSLSLAKPQ